MRESHKAVKISLRQGQWSCPGATKVASFALDGKTRLFRHSDRDATLVLLALVHGWLLWHFPSIPLLALGLWWNANTIAHNFIHKPFFHWPILNRISSLGL